MFCTHLQVSYLIRFMSYDRWHHWDKVIWYYHCEYIKCFSFLIATATNYHRVSCFKITQIHCLTILEVRRPNGSYGTKIKVSAGPSSFWRFRIHSLIFQTLKDTCIPRPVTTFHPQSQQLQNSNLCFYCVSPVSFLPPSVPFKDPHDYFGPTQIFQK